MLSHRFPFSLCRNRFEGDIGKIRVRAITGCSECLDLIMTTPIKVQRVETRARIPSCGRGLDGPEES